MKKAIFTSFALGIRWTLALAMIAIADLRVSAQCSLTCNNLVQISLDQSCEAEILPDMIAEGNGCPNGNLHVQARINNQWVPASGNFVATAAHINQTLQVRVRDAVTGNFCWGMLKVEDKLPPQISCTNITIPCAVSNYTPAYLKNVLGINAAEPTVNENCGSFTQSYTDTWVDLNCNQTIHGLSNISGYIQRFWTVIDQSGNANNCTQFIYLERKNLTDITLPADVTISCPSGPNVDPAVSGTPSFTINNVTIPLFPQNTQCEFNVAYQDQLLPICDGTFKILRTWTLLDWCKPTSQNSANPNPLFYIQVIKIEDADGPIINCPEDITVNTNSNNCNRTLDLPDVIVADGCSRIKSAVAQWFVNGQGFTLNGTITSFPGNNFWNPDTLAAFGFAQNLPLGTTQMTYIITDDCGNSSTCQFNITVADETPPTVACDEFTKVALGADGMALVNATTFDDGSFDNCSPNVYFKARRMDNNDCQTNSQFHDQVKFCCEDIGQSITVILRVYDIQPPAGSISLAWGEDNANECMIQVTVEDKIKPNCISPANVTVSCESFDPSLWAYGKAQVSDNCCLDDTKVYQGQIGLTHTANFSQFDTVCNRGTITRTFRAFDCFGNSSQCTQRVIVNYNQNYFIRFPDDVLVTQCDGTPNFGAPTFFGEDCELLGVSHVDEIFTVVPDACYKIERTWTILNWCQYNPNGACTVVPNPEPNININAPQNRPGPIVSACGTPAPWAPTTVAIGPGQPPTNYCAFWSANANCYKYKQIIKVIDNVAPTVV
ncbi:MAG: HYR domain-containing protein, partial [Saprospiraceae bacterium]